MTFEDIARTSGTRRAFGFLVRDKRVALEMAQEDLATEAQCLRYQVRDVEVGACYLPGVLRRVGEVLGIEPGKVRAGG